MQHRARGRRNVRKRQGSHCRCARTHQGIHGDYASVYCSSSETTIEELLQKNLATLSVIVRAQKPRRCTCCWLCSCRLQTCLHAAWQEARANKNRLYHARKQWRSRVIRLRCDHLRKASIPHSTVEEKIQKVHGRSASHDQPPPPPPPPPPLLSSLPWKELRDIATSLKPETILRGATLFNESDSVPVSAAGYPFILVTQGSVAISFPRCAPSDTTVASTPSEISKTEVPNSYLF